MGLDVTVHKGVSLQKEGSENYDFVAYVIDDNWLGRIKNLQNMGRYKSSMKKRVLSYPCSSHNDFRREICSMLGMEPDEWIVDNKDWDYSKPFSEFFQFADNDGCMDWETASKLYDDFYSHSESFKDHLSSMDRVSASYYQDKYDAWTTIFLMAKNKGVVQYH